MVRYGKWEPIEEIGKGGQGVVYRVRDSSVYDLEKIAQKIPSAVLQIDPAFTWGEQNASAHVLAQELRNYGSADEYSNCGALKLLHKPQDSAGYPAEQLERMKREVYALKKRIHPNVVTVLDERIEDRWFVTEYFRMGALLQNRGGYKGDLTRTLSADLPPIVVPLSKLVRTPLPPGGAERNPVATAGSLAAPAVGIPTRCVGVLGCTAAAIARSALGPPSRCQTSRHSGIHLETSH